jgi:hypothetical protein
MPIALGVFPALSCTSFKFQVILRSLIHFEFILTQGERHGSQTCRYPGFPVTFVDKAIFSPSYVFGTIVKNQVSMVS